MCFICMLLFSVLSLLAFCKSSEKTVKTIQTIEKTQIPFDFAVVLVWSSAVSEGSDRLKVELSLFSLSPSAVLPHAYLVHLIRYITFSKEFSATSFDPIPISFQTSVSTFMWFGERPAWSIFYLPLTTWTRSNRVPFSSQWLGFHDSTYPWGVTSEY